jgi:hypothetical protein
MRVYLLEWSVDMLVDEGGAKSRGTSLNLASSVELP